MTQRAAAFGAEISRVLILRHAIRRFRRIMPAGPSVNASNFFSVFSLITTAPYVGCAIQGVMGLLSLAEKYKVVGREVKHF